MTKPIFKRFAWIIGGGVAGFAWYYFVGCASGSCPISSNPYISTVYGAVVGGLASWNSARSTKKTIPQGPSSDE